MDRNKRKEDPPNVDHHDERTLDWKSASPRWLLLAVIFVALSWGAMMSGLCWNFYRLHLEAQERRYSDWKAGMVADHEQRITVLERDAENNRDAVLCVDAENKLTRLGTQMENVNQKVDQLRADVLRAIRER